MEEDSLIEIHDYPEPLGNAQADLVVATFHDEAQFQGPLAEVMEGHREHLTDEDLAVWEDFLTLEPDVNSGAVAQAVIDRLKQEDPHLRIRYFRSRLHRAVLDGNRADVDESRRQLWKQEGQGLWTDLGRLHADYMRQLRTAVPENQFRHALDVHTMYPYSPAEKQVSGHQALQEHPGKLGAYVDSYLLARERGGVRRPLDLLCNDGAGVLRGNEGWAGALTKELSARGVPSQRDFPYNLGDRQLNSKWLLGMAQNRGLVLDIPKSELVDDYPKDGQFRQGVISTPSMNRVVDSIVRSYLEIRRN